MVAVSTYLDWNATTPPAPEVLAAMRRASEVAWANPASVHGPGRAARASVEHARQAIATLVGLDARDVLLTSGGTEANNLALMAAFGDVRARDESGPAALVLGAIEHPSVTRFADYLAQKGVEVLRVQPREDGVVPVDGFREAVDRCQGRLRLVSIQAVNHETGVVQPVSEVAELAHAHGAWLHCDAVQAVGRLPRTTWEAADLVTIAAHKIRGPKGIGALATRCGIKLLPVLLGGAQERGIRPGTQDPVAAAGFAVAAERALSTPNAYKSVAQLRDRLEEALLHLGGVRNGDARRASHVSNVSFPKWLGAELCAALDLEGVSASSGSACSAGTADPSPVITAMLGVERARSAIRFSLGETSSQSDVDSAVTAIRKVFAR